MPSNIFEREAHVLMLKSICFDKKKKTKQCMPPVITFQKRIPLWLELGTSVTCKPPQNITYVVSLTFLLSTKVATLFVWVLNWETSIAIVVKSYDQIFAGLLSAEKVSNSCQKCYLRIQMWDKEGHMGWIDYQNFLLDNDQPMCYSLRLGKRTLRNINSNILIANKQ